MSKKQLIISLAGLGLIAGCLIFIASNTGKLPPGTIKPNAKPTLSSTGSAQKLKVNAQPTSQAILTSVNSSKSASQPAASETSALNTASEKIQAANCKTPDTAQSTANLTASLNSISGVQKVRSYISGSQLKQGVLDVTDVLGQ